MASKFNIRNGDIILKINNKWTFCTEQELKSFLLKRDQVFELILIRLEFINNININDLKVSIDCEKFEKLQQKFVQEFETLNEELVRNDVEFDQQLENVWEMALTHSQDIENINDWHYLAINESLFEKRFRINETEPYIMEDYGIRLISGVHIESQQLNRVKNDLEKLTNRAINEKVYSPEPWRKRFFRKTNF
jgi:hypothetical protein